jgi:alpha-glucosidase (family GH31 glycosyl hydrolase)
MTVPTETRRIPLPPDEQWWGGAVADGRAMPFGSSVHRRDLRVNAGYPDDPNGGANQAAPLLVSSQGRYVWSDEPFEFAFTPGELVVDGVGVQLGQGERPTLAGAFRAASAAHFPPSGRAPAAGMFTGPQYNTWMELPYAPTQQGVLDYVRGMLDAGFPPGLVMIDDRWSRDYGVWRFDRTAFPDPAAMVDRLHEWGCSVMLWLVPFVSPDSAVFRRLEADGLLLRDADGEVAIRRWWNGFSAVLDVTNPAAVDFLCGELAALVDEFGIDGFKFDAGDLRDYRPGDISYHLTDPAGHCQAWAQVGRRYEFNEFRACWKMGGQPLAERLHDKPGRWDGEGLESLIPESIAQGLIGHPFICPDMIGGGALGDAAREDLDQELFVRYAQLSALFPMMQFSLAPHRVLDAEHLAAVLDAVRLRQQLMPELLEMVEQAARTGEPIIRALAYDDPQDTGAADQFTLAGRILVAPVLTPGATRRTVRLPAGTWTAADGTTHTGPTTLDVPVNLHTLPWFRRG